MAKIKECEYCGYGIHGEAVAMYQTILNGGSCVIIDRQPPQPGEYPKSDHPKTKIVWWHKECMEKDRQRIQLPLPAGEAADATK